VDLVDPTAPAALVADVEAGLGAVEILVANHGIGQQAAYEDVDAEAFDRTVAINLRAPFLLARAALGGMRERGFGRILFISSLAAGIPVGRVGRPDEIAQLAIATLENGYLTNKVLTIDDGSYPR
jgi:NAD(P)-dependent dehydrogenase (short-subunit alcohol dehydrogenase family)